MLKMNKILWGVLLVLLPVFPGCVSVGRDFHGGFLPEVGEYTVAPLPLETDSAPVHGGEAQHFVDGMDISSQWWTKFQSVELDALICQALEDSPTLSAAEATLREARENVNARTGSQNYPAASLGLDSSRFKSSPASFGMPDGEGNILNLHSASVAVSYTFDIFGGARREIEALKARVDYEKFRLEAARLVLGGNIVTTVIREAALRAELQATKEIIAAQKEQLELIEQQQALGGASRSEVLGLRAEVEAVRATLPVYEKELGWSRHQLATLLGRLPSESGSLAQFELSSFVLPVELPLSLPSDFARQRPDIRAAEALLQVASAGVGVATANLFPQITLGGSYGPQAGRWENLFKGESLVWSLAGGLTQPIFNGGSLRARKRGAQAAFDQAAANYRQTVLGAFQNIADTLHALETDASVLKAQASAYSAAEESLMLARKQFQSGAISYSVVLNAQQQYQRASIALVRAQAARLSDTAALFQSLGGGWENRDQDVLPGERE
jgi:NodT family efflux transporter outer membrane factor (OMF) lipoprotein